jgi:hypothetical protein
MVALRAVALWIPGDTGRAYSPNRVEEAFSEVHFHDSVWFGLVEAGFAF